MASTIINLNDPRLASLASALGGVTSASYQDFIKIINASPPYAQQLDSFLGIARLMVSKESLNLPGADGVDVPAAGRTDPISKEILLSIPNLPAESMKSQGYVIAQVLAHELGHAFDPGLEAGNGVIGEARAEINAYKLMSEADINLVRNAQNVSAAGGELFRANKDTSMP
ncbi:hypothetical protein [Caballeronia ptereochthonis]|uniref:Uncharacterized protein n=1 Tax=Caballeronia ptereochthonis TaxID=1777144 RepID=A0A158E0N0_9BURK|nr:hypothetical protein [Caballeronia ptereochthonis]SAL00388.1 hypothetical protein AWB83_06235 [Caballeronia ptereochthonis]